MPSVLRIGPPAKKNAASSISSSIPVRLRLALLFHFNDKAGLGKTEGSNVISIANKYFSAEVALELLSNGQHGGCSGNEDGIVLCFDARSSSSTAGKISNLATSFDSLTAVHEAAVESGQAGDLLRLCVGVSLDGPIPPPDCKETEDEYSRRVLWCLDRGYEYVEADLSDSGIRRGHDERDKEGFARVAEAIGGTVWSSSTMRPRKVAQLRRNYDETERGLQHALSEKAATPIVVEGNIEENLKGGLTSGQKVGVDAEIDCTFTPADKDESREERMQKKAEDMLQVNPPDHVRGDDAKDDSLFTELDTVLQEASAVRIAARSGELSDDERRKRAGDVAMMLAGMLDRMGSDDGNDESDDEQ